MILVENLAGKYLSR